MELNEINDPLLTDVETNTTKDWDHEEVGRNVLTFFVILSIIGSVIGVAFAIKYSEEDNKIYGKYEIKSKHYVKCVVDNSLASDSILIREGDSIYFLDIIRECLVNLTVGS
jgi:hypothetical protein